MAKWRGVEGSECYWDSQGHQRREAGQLTIWGQCGEGHNSWRAVVVVRLMRYKLERSERALLVTLSVS